MISTSYSIYEFLDTVRGKNAVEAIAMAQQESYEAELLTSGGRRGAPAARAAGCDRYSSDLKGFIFFLSNGVKPAGVADGVYRSFISTAKELKGIKMEALEKLDGESK